MRVVIGSSSSAKVSAARVGFSAAFPGDKLNFVAIDVSSGVPDQPRGGQETRLGAKNRAERALELDGRNAEYYLGAEGGIEEIEGEVHCFAWICIIEGKKGGKRAMARTASFPIATRVTELMNECGLELGHAADRVYGMSDGKGRGGLVGAVTGGKITRADFYAHAIVLALSVLTDSSQVPLEEPSKHL